MYFRLVLFSLLFYSPSKTGAGRQHRTCDCSRHSSESGCHSRGRAECDAAPTAQRSACLPPAFYSAHLPTVLPACQQGFFVCQSRIISEKSCTPYRNISSTLLSFFIVREQKRYSVHFKTRLRAPVCAVCLMQCWWNGAVRLGGACVMRLMLFALRPHTSFYRVCSCWRMLSCRTSHVWMPFADTGAEAGTEAR